MQKEVVAELIQDELNAGQLFQEMQAIIFGDKKETLRSEYQNLKTILGQKNASECVAKHILNEL
jgi:lipid A disaccharide synthetase